MGARHGDGRLAPTDTSAERHRPTSTTSDLGSSRISIHNANRDNGRRTGCRSIRTPTALLLFRNAFRKVLLSVIAAANKQKEKSTERKSYSS